MLTKRISPNDFYTLADGTLVRVEAAHDEQPGRFWVWESDSQEPYLVSARELKAEDRDAKDAWATRHRAD